MMFVIGIALFALCILVSVALHECGHMWVARATGMKVRRYFVGFGPTLWSTRRPNKLGDTEYGLKAIPLGGFCDIAGMTAIDEIAPEDQQYAMYQAEDLEAGRGAVRRARHELRHRAGADLRHRGHLGTAEPASAHHRDVGETACVAPQISKGKLGDCTGPRPGGGRRHPAPATSIVKVGDTVGRHLRRDGRRGAQGSTGPTPVRRRARRQAKSPRSSTSPRTQRCTAEHGRRARHRRRHRRQLPPQFGPDAVQPAVRDARAPFAFTGDLAVELGKSLAKIPTKIGALVHSIGGGERDPETPISVVGASIIGGDTVDHGLWVAFWFFLAQLNFVLGAINLVPLLPFDGGHIAIAVFEKIRNMIRTARGKVAAAPVNYLKLMPATYVVLVVVVGYMLLTVTADLVNPIRLFQ